MEQGLIFKSSGNLSYFFLISSRRSCHCFFFFEELNYEWICSRYPLSLWWCILILIYAQSTGSEQEYQITRNCYIGSSSLLGMPLSMDAGSSRSKRLPDHTFVLADDSHRLHPSASIQHRTYHIWSMHAYIRLFPSSICREMSNTHCFWWQSQNDPYSVSQHALVFIF